MAGRLGRPLPRPWREENSITRAEKGSPSLVDSQRCRHWEHDVRRPKEAVTLCSRLTLVSGGQPRMRTHFNKKLNNTRDTE